MRPRRFELPCLALRPRWAREIFAGEKHWEFRLRPLPLHRPMAVYESAPAKRITGAVMFDSIVAARPMDALGMIAGLGQTLEGYRDSRPGSITLKELDDYSRCGIVFAHHVADARTVFGLAGVGVGSVPKPPQCWGTVNALLSRPDAALLEAIGVPLVETGNG